MAELHDTGEKAERAFLVGIYDDKTNQAEAESLLVELKGLCSTLGIEVAGSIVARLRERTAALLLGTGKSDEIAAAAKAEGADSIVFDRQLTPVQQRNWEALSGLKAYDRNELIIRIFASRARTKEAAFQVELAQLKYALPRLAHSYEDLSRQRGGRYGTKGSGEQKIELDRREIERRIHDLEDQLEELRKARGVQRSRREKAAVPRAAIVGYTNAGKSSLLNALAAADVLAQNKLFATLDPTTRKMNMRKGGSLLLTDTVGFVRNLPHHLVEAFKATLEEAAQADLLVEVVDASDPEAELHMEATDKVLREIGAADLPRVLALNKADLVGDPAFLEGWKARRPEGLLCSVKTGMGLAELSAAIEDKLTADSGECRLRVPDADYALVALLHREASILEESHDGEASLLRVRLPDRIKSKFEAYKVE